MKFYLQILLVLIALSYFKLYGQTLIQVRSAENNTPIEKTLVSSKTNYTVTDESGYFNLLIFNKIDTISFSHIGYQKKIITYKQLLTLSEVLLLPKDITLNEVLISGENTNANKVETKETIKLNSNIDKAYTDVGELLKKKSSLNIKDYGSYVGLKTVSSRGLSSENTLVLFNEAKINDLRTGSFDLSQLSSFAVDKIDYIKNSSERNYAGGVLKIVSESPKQNNFKFGTKLSSDNLQAYWGRVNRTINKFSFGINAERSFSPNHYNFSFENNKYKRQNAQFSKSFINSTLNYSAQKLIIKFYNHYSYINNGIPGYVVTNNTASSKASSKNSAYLSVLNAFYNISQKLINKSTVSYHLQNNQLLDPQGEVLFNNKKSESNLSDLSFNNIVTYSEPSWKINLGYEFNQSDIDSLSSFSTTATKAGDFKRTNHVFYSSTQYSIYNFNYIIKELSISTGVSHSIIDDNFYVDNNSSTNSFSAGLSLTPDFIKEFNITFNYSNNNRMPTFNEAYYSNLLSNTKLKNEKFDSWDIGINSVFKELHLSKVSINYFRINGDDKIIWVPTRLALQIPKNISKIKSEGIEIWLEHNSKYFYASANYNYTEALNKTQQSANDLSFNKQLVYSPKHRFNFNLSFSYKNLVLSTYNSYVSERFYTADNNKDNKLPQYFITDFSIGYSFKLLSVNHSLTFTALNLLNEEYFIIQSYPMPLRNYMINYQLEIL